nr:hypothetical protein [Tanacetum cinerariifolium]
MDTCTALTRRSEQLELDKIAQALEITKLKRRVKKLERGNKVKVLKLIRLQKVGTAQRIDTSDDTVMDDVSNKGRMIADMDVDADVVLEEAKDVADDAKTDQDVENVAGFKMDYFKGMTYDDIRPVFEKHFDLNVAFLQKTKEQIKEEEIRALKRINKTLAEKAAKS